MTFIFNSFSTVLGTDTFMNLLTVLFSSFSLTPRKSRFESSTTSLPPEDEFQNMVVFQRKGYPL